MAAGAKRVFSLNPTESRQPCRTFPLLVTRIRRTSNGFHPDHGGWSFRPPAPPAVSSVDLSLEAVPFVTGWNRALARPAAVEVRRVELAAAPLRVVSVPIRGQAIRTRSFLFSAEPAPSVEWPAAVAARAPSPGRGPADDLQRRADAPRSSRRRT